MNFTCRKQHPAVSYQRSAISHRLLTILAIFFFLLATNHRLLYYYNARYYDPALGTFVSADPTDDFLNRFGYVGGNPITATDPSGHRAVGDGEPPITAENLEYMYGLDIVTSPQWTAGELVALQWAVERITGRSNNRWLLRGVTVEKSLSPYLPGTDRKVRGYASLEGRKVVMTSYGLGKPHPERVFIHEFGHVLEPRFGTALWEFAELLSDEGVEFRYPENEGDPSYWGRAQFIWGDEDNRVEKYSRMPKFPMNAAVGIREAYAEFFAAYYAPEISTGYIGIGVDEENVETADFRMPPRLFYYFSGLFEIPHLPITKLKPFELE